MITKVWYEETWSKIIIHTWTEVDWLFYLNSETSFPFLQSLYWALILHAHIAWGILCCQSHSLAIAYNLAALWSRTYDSFISSLDFHYKDLPMPSYLTFRRKHQCLSIVWILLTRGIICTLKQHWHGAFSFSWPNGENKDSSRMILIIEVLFHFNIWTRGD